MSDGSIDICKQRCNCCSSSIKSRLSFATAIAAEAEEEEEEEASDDEELANAENENEDDATVTEEEQAKNRKNRFVVCETIIIIQTRLTGSSSKFSVGNAMK